MVSRLTISGGPDQQDEWIVGRRKWIVPGLCWVDMTSPREHVLLLLLQLALNQYWIASSVCLFASFFFFFSPPFLGMCACTRVFTRVGLHLYIIICHAHVHITRPSSFVEWGGVNWLLTLWKCALIWRQCRNSLLKLNKWLNGPM